MAYLVGAGLALAVSLLGTVAGLERDRAFYPTLLIVIAAYYGLFVAMAVGPSDVGPEVVAMLGFIVVSILGFKRSLWFVVAGLCAHGLFDLGHARLIANPGVPVWWPPFCLAYDVTAGAYLAWSLIHSRIIAVPA